MLEQHPGRTVRLYQVSSVFGRAYADAASVKNVTSGFAKSGICPLNRLIFPDHLFLPSQVSEIVINVISPGTHSLQYELDV
jgi:hypothetical protein